ncbi:hypothetical protein C8N36_114116 [Pelagimonas varians]|uniref:Uncharacterized protein n=1 Tax=Pelagimonas varians TaxID=696760 RepID=A0A238KYD1_9RHOB|nr:hypothetical protein C8N36_114116 [Pelagimonas varians]SMX47698.1 hypothetical protein PEV8663_03615 [Pelagimonas varians]
MPNFGGYRARFWTMARLIKVFGLSMKPLQMRFCASEANGGFCQSLARPRFGLG